MHAQQMQQTTMPRTIQAQVAELNEEVDHLLYCQMKVRHLQHLLIASGVRLVTDNDNPYHVRVQEAS